MPAVATAQQADCTYRPTVEEGKTWWYHGIRYVDAQSPRLQENFGVRIGESTTIDGVDWHPCSLVAADNLSEMLDPVIAYVREADKKVYFKPAGHELNFDNPAYTAILEENYLEWNVPYSDEVPAEGILIYDWNLNPGETIELYDSGVMTLNSVDYATSCGIERKVQNFSKDSQPAYSAAEGIGFAYNDWDSFFFWLQKDQITSIMQRWTLQFIAVCNADGEMVWKFSDEVTNPWEYDGIEDVTADETCSWNYSDGTFTIPSDGTLAIFDTAGNEVTRIKVAAGTPVALPVSAGIYVLELKTATGTQHGKIMR
ncbi:MAG: T9SS type A sorting domain-containing protein [Muribaculaceae bacterium]|nr:T9SS type A sorting domain-containing protein [Muribaculaceae bacterium]